jgi:hypothetical protein
MNKNSLIASLPKHIQELIFFKGELIILTLSEVICVVDEPVKYIHFPTDGFISIVQSLDQHPPLEIGMIGREGVLGAEIALNIKKNLFGALVQGCGNAWRLGVNDFLDIMKDHVELKNIIHTYLAVRIKQLSLSAACEHFHEIGPRLGKWLLMSEDRAQSDTFFMTHEFISLMLGVRRVGITTAAAEFRRNGLIEYRRGEMKILNRPALMKASCSCYLQNRKIYTGLIG